MRSALEIVAFSQGTRAEGIAALLTTALEAMDERSFALAAFHVQMALNELARRPDAADACGPLEAGRELN